MSMRLTAMLLLTASLIASFPAFAIQVSVQSNNSHILGLGFKVNGEKHGGLGTHYQASDMPVGVYVFGVRMDGQDVRCMDRKGRTNIQLSNDARVVLNFEGSKCLLTVASS